MALLGGLAAVFVARRRTPYMASLQAIVAGLMIVVSIAGVARALSLFSGFGLDAQVGVGGVLFIVIAAVYAVMQLRRV